MKKRKCFLVKHTPVVYMIDGDFLDLMFYGDCGSVSFTAMANSTGAYKKNTIAEFIKLRDTIDMAIDDMVSFNHNQATKENKV